MSYFNLGGPKKGLAGFHAGSDSPQLAIYGEKTITSYS